MQAMLSSTSFNDMGYQLRKSELGQFLYASVTPAF